MNKNSITNITNKILKYNQYLSVLDAEILFNATSYQDLKIIQESANELREKLVGNNVSYIINQNVNFTNICANFCLFCGFRCSEDDEKAYIITIDDLFEKLSKATQKGAREVCFQGGLHPNLQIKGLNAKDFIQNYGLLLTWVKENFPQLITHAYSPEEIFFIHQITGKSTQYILEYLKDSGLDTMPGTAAEILNDNIRKQICPKKLSTNEWIKVITEAHQLNIPTTATIMYGHFEKNSDLAEHLNILRTIQLQTKGFTEFIPLPFVSTKTILAGKFKNLTKEDRLKMLAISRLFFADLIPNIQASWVKQGIEETTESLYWGVNDVGGTLGDECITFSAGGTFGKSVEAIDLVNIINSANRTPVMRDTVYNTITSKDLCPVG